MRRTAAAVALFSLLASGPALSGAPGEEETGADATVRAQAPAQAPAKVGGNDELWSLAGTWTVVMENDRFSDTDRHYTHGSRFAWVSDKKGEGPGPVRDVLQLLYPFADTSSGRFGLAFGQNIYTPENITRKEPDPKDRPYAGWLYLAPSVAAETKQRVFGQPMDVLDTVEMEIGVVGPYSLAEPTQKFVHRTIDTTRPQGWDRQLSNEPGIVFIGERKWRTPPLGLGPLQLDAIPHVGAALGNVYTHGNTGFMLRLGRALDLDWGPPHIQPSLSGIEAVDRGSEFGWYVFAGAEGRAVARNIFLDGNSFVGSPSVDKKPFVGELQFGFAIVYRGIRLAMTQVMRTKEFDGQSEGDAFGSLSLSARF